MKYLPFEFLLYETELSEQEALEKLSDCTQPKKMRFFKAYNPTKTYEGSIDENTFEISRIINYRNSFLPQITGTVQNNGSRTEIEIKMQLNTIVLLFLIFCCSMVFLFFLMAIFSAAEITIASFAPLLMLVFIYFLTIFCFNYESTKAKAELKKIFKAQKVIEK